MRKEGEQERSGKSEIKNLADLVQEAGGRWGLPCPYNVHDSSSDSL